jgi:phosphoribosylformylglycinamidine synthase
LNVPKVAGFEDPNGLKPEESGRLLHFYKAVERAVSLELVASCHGIYRGGLGVHAAMAAIGGGLGMTIGLAKAPVAGEPFEIRDDQLMFSESCGRFLVTVPKAMAGEFEKLFDGLPYGLVGEVTEAPELVITGRSGKQILRENIFTLRKSWMGI